MLRRTAVKEVLAVDIEIKGLVEALAANVSAELERVIAHDLAEAVGPLKGVSDLRQFAFAVVADGESTAQLNERQTFVLGPRPG